MVFSTNQVRQLYVVTGEMTDSQMKTHAAGGTQQNAGSTLLKAFDDWGQHEDPKTFEFFYVNALKELGHSDIIHRENIRKITKTPAAKLRMYLPYWKVTNTLTASTDYEVGDTFYINFTFPGFLNATDEEIETKTVAMTYEDPTTAGSWGDQMVNAITLAFNVKKNLDNDLLSVEVDQTDSNTIYITGKEGGPWHVGVADNKPTQIVIDNLTWENLHDPSLSTLPLENNSNVGTYGTAENLTGTANSPFVGNGKRTADLEYFCMGERGDQYRNIGWPNVIHTKYMINDTSKEYDYLDIHYYFQGEGVRSDKSEKLLTLVAESGTTYLDDFLTVLCNSNGMLDVTEQNPVPSNTPEGSDTSTPEPSEPVTEPSITVNLDTPTFDSVTSEVSLSASVTATNTTVSTVTFVYDTDSNFSASTSANGTLNSSTNKYEATLTSLSANTYYVKATATDGTLTANSSVQTVVVS